jgi:hypothetical protein
MTIEQYVGLLILVTIIGMYSAFLYGKRISGFRVHKYFLILLLPMLGVVGLVNFFGKDILYFYILSCILGFILEGLYGWVYHKTQGERFWKYYRYTVGGHTSFLTPPLWGLAGVTFFLLAYFTGL